MTHITRRQFPIGSAGLALSTIAAGTALTLLCNTAAESQSRADVSLALVESPQPAQRRRQPVPYDFRHRRGYRPRRALEA